MDSLLVFGVLWLTLSYFIRPRQTKKGRGSPGSGEDPANTEEPGGIQNEATLATVLSTSIWGVFSAGVAGALNHRSGSSNASVDGVLVALAILFWLIGGMSYLALRRARERDADPTPPRAGE